MSRKIILNDFSQFKGSFHKTGTPPTEKKTIAKEGKGDLSKLIKQADEALRIHVRKRDGAAPLVGCCTCSFSFPVNKMQVGHYVSRKQMATRWDVRNVALQCVQCNCIEMGKPVEFAAYINQRYGAGTAEALIEKSKVTGKLNPEKIREIIKDLQAK